MLFTELSVHNAPVFKDGGKIGEEIKCKNCNWEWNTKDSEEFDKYVCHECGFDNKHSRYEKGGSVEKLYDIGDLSNKKPTKYYEL